MQEDFNMKRDPLIPWQCKTPEDYASMIKDLCEKARRFGGVL